jgi:lipoprotein-anchoring transpeptidase ErfK/SrfK
MMVNTTGALRPITKRAAVAGLCGLLAILATGCGGDSGSAPIAAVYPAPAIRITPVTGALNVRPDKPVEVQAVNGRLTAVTVRAGSQDAAGQLNFEATEWTSLWALHPGTTYLVQATVTNPAGQAVTTTSRFRTLRPAEMFSASLDWTLAGSQGQSYGVGLPIVLNFSQPVKDKAAVQEALVVQAQKPVPGAWRWITDEQVVYRGETFWPAHQTVTLQAHLAGVQASPGIYGTTDQAYTFKIGAARVSTVDVRAHRISVQVDGKVVRQYGISAGDGTALVYTTPSGTALTMDKARMVIMTNPNVPQGAPGWYREPVPLAVRLTNSGIYLHETPGAAWCLGVANCSHGCIRQPADEAEWFYDTSQPADVVRVEGTNRTMSWDDGWTFYQMPWKQWMAASLASYTPSTTGY